MSIAHPALECIERSPKDQHDVSSLANLFLALDLILRVNTCVHAARFIRMGCRDDKVRMLLLKSQFSFGDWHALLQALVTVMKDEETRALSRWFQEMERCCETLKSIECRNSPLQTLLKIRNRSAHRLNRMSPEFIDACYPVAQCCIQRLLDSHPPLGYFETADDGELWYKVKSNIELPCWPFVLPGTLNGAPDALLIYSGNSTKVFEYDSTRTELYSSSQIHDDVIGLLKHSYASQETLASTENPHEIRERLYEATKEAVCQKQQVGHYRPLSFLHRPEPDAVFDSFVQGALPLLVIEGPVGAGKTSWLCAQAERRIATESAVLLAPVERLPSVSFPRVLGDFTRVRGEMGTALERLSAASKDRRVVILIDDLGAAGHEREALAYIFNWVGTMGQGSSVRIAVTIRSEQLHALRQHADVLWNPDKVRHYVLPPFSSPELLALANKLPIEDVVDPEALRCRRIDVALRLGSLRDSYVRRPGLATTILGFTSEPITIPTTGAHGRGVSPVSAFSADSVYAEIIRRDVLSSAPEGSPRTPLRLSLLKGIANLMLELSCTELPIDRLGGLTGHFIEKETGRRTADYEALLSSQILIETLDDFEPKVSFAQRLFFEYTAALNFSPDKGLENSVGGLCGRSRSFPPTLVVAAFLVIRGVKKAGTLRTWEVVYRLAEWRFRLLREIAPLNGTALLELLGPIAEHCASEATDLVAWLIDSGEPRLGSLAAQILYEKATEPPVQKEARFQQARAHFEMDEYAQVTEQLKEVRGHRAFHVSILLGDVAASKGNWEEGRICYEEALRQTSKQLEKAHGLRGLGFILGKLFILNEAEQRLKESLAILAANPGSRVEAEAWSDLGEVLIEKGERADATRCFEKSMEINRRNGCLVGIGIVEGLLGSIDLASGDFNRAEQRLNSALENALLTENRYRQAFVLSRLAQLKKRVGEFPLAEALQAESSKIYGQIGGRET